MTSLMRLKDSLAHRWNSLNESWRVAITFFVIARLLYGIWSLTIFLIQPVAIQNFELSGEPILSVFNLKDSQAYIYLREVNGEILSFRLMSTSLMVDQQTGSIWRFSDGRAVQGRFRESTLKLAGTQPFEIFPYHGVASYPQPWLALWQRFDANWYVSIAENGYGSIPGDVHFPPLYPLLIRVLQPIFDSAFLGGVFLSHLATLYTLKLLYDLFIKWGDSTTARRAVLFFVIYPTFFFCFSAYSEPVFLAATLLAFRAMTGKYWHWAGFWIFCAVLLRLQGVALLAPMLFLMWRDPPFLHKTAHWAGLVLAGLGGVVYLYLRSLQAGENTLPLVESSLHARIVTPWQSYGYAVQTLISGKGNFVDLINWAIATLFILIMIWGWKLIPLEYNIYIVCSVLIIVTRVVETQPLVSFSRYSLTFFPVFYMLAIAGQKPWTRRAIVYASILLSLYLSGQFFIWGWVA